MHFYRLFRFHSQSHFRASLSVRVFDSGHPVMYVRNVCTNKPGHKIYRWTSARSTRYHTLIHDPTILDTKTFPAPVCHPRKIYLYMPTRSTRHHTLLHNLTILHTKTFLYQPVTRTRKYRPIQNCHSLHQYNHSRLTRNHLLKNTIQTHIRFETFPFSFH